MSFTLSADPFQLFYSSNTPIGLYARQKWLNESNTDSWHNDYNHTVNYLLDGQYPNGSWHNSPINTIHRLFGLHLTIRETNDSINSALDWLIGTISPPIPLNIIHPKERVKGEMLAGLPFSAAHYNMLIISSTLFLFTVFGRGNEYRIIKEYRKLEKVITDRDITYGWKCLSNMLRALVVHGSFSHSNATETIVRELRKIQTRNGNWGNNVPFYRTLNALAHLEFQEARLQFDNALSLLYKTQFGNGHWGRVEKEFKTFLVVHALKRKSYL